MKSYGLILTDASHADTGSTGPFKKLDCDPHPPQAELVFAGSDCLVLRRGIDAGSRRVIVRPTQKLDRDYRSKFQLLFTV
jgi:hypothetical protein